MALKHPTAVAFTLILFLCLVLFSGIIVFSLIRDVSLTEFTFSNPEGNIFVESLPGGSNISYRWNYQGLHTQSVFIPDRDFLVYSLKERSLAKEYSYYVQDDSSVVDNLSSNLLSIAKDNQFSPLETVSFITSYVQSFKGTPDFYDDYAQFPLETLRLATGDCEDVAILAAKLLSAADIDVILIELGDHVGIGVAVNGSGDFFEFNDKKYYYVEMTGVNNAVGYLPAQFSNRLALFYDPQLPVYNPRFNINKITRGNDTFYNVSLELAEQFTGNISFELQYINTSNSSIIELKEERLVSAMLPVFPSLDHRLVMELRGFSASVLILQTEWISQY